MSIYQINPDAPSDEHFDPGELHHLVVGNSGRLLDPRRTPVTIVELRLRTGMFILRIDDFEDLGAMWEIPFEEIDRYQFLKGADRATANQVAEFQEVVRHFDRRSFIAIDDAARERTERDVRDAQESARTWLNNQSVFLRHGAGLPPPASRTGDARLWADLSSYMDSLNLAEMESAFARQFVTGPHSGEIVKGHQVVMAELGLVPYDGKIIRDPATFKDQWAPGRRVEHIIARLGFIRALFTATGFETVTLYRGMAISGRLEPPHNHTFVSATFSRDVAESHFEIGDEMTTRVLYAQSVPIERLFMTYHETEAMNRQFLEAEAVLLWQEDQRAF